MAGISVVLLLTAGGRAFSTWSKWGTAQVPYFVNPQNLGLPEAVVIAALQNAAAAWSTQSAASTSLYYAGLSTDTAVTYDGKPTVMFRNAANGGALATTYAWSTNGQIVDADVVFWDGGFTFFTGSTDCVNGAYVEDIATHEFGHVLGLLHSTDVSATMYPYYSYCSTAPRTLSPDDVAGIEALYPAATPPPTVTITKPTNGVSAAQGSLLSFQGSAADAHGGDLSSQLVWRSTVDGPIGTGAAVGAVLSVGTHVVIASVTDSAGSQSSSQVGVTVLSSCVRSAPVITMSPGLVSVAAGVAQPYTVTIANNDDPSCGTSSYLLTATIPSGWTAALPATAAVAPGTQAAISMTVTAPAGAAAATYPVSVAATNNSAAAYSASAVANEAIIADFAVTVSTNAATYSRGASVTMSALVLKGQAPVGGAKVTFTLTMPDGSSQRWAVNANPSGVAKQNVKIGNAYPLGAYVLLATATKNGLSGAGTTTFVVK